MPSDAFRLRYNCIPSARMLRLHTVSLILEDIWTIRDPAFGCLQEGPLSGKPILRVLFLVFSLKPQLKKGLMLFRIHFRRF